MGVSFSRALSAVFLGSVVIGFSYAVARYGLSPWKNNPFHPLTSLGQTIQRNLYPFELRAEDLARAAAMREVKDPALMPKVATPCDTTWRVPLGRLGYSAEYYKGKSPVQVKPTKGAQLSATVITKGNSLTSDRDHVTAVSNVSPEIYPMALRISMMEYIQRRVFGDKPMTDDGRNYNTALFTHGSPWPRARGSFDGYYAIMVNGQQIPFLPPAVQDIPTRFENGGTEYDGYPYYTKPTQPPIDKMIEENAWHWVNIMQWPQQYYSNTGHGPQRKSVSGEPYNRLERDIAECQFQAYDFMNHARPQEAATLEWYPVMYADGRPGGTFTSKEGGFEAVQFAQERGQYLPLGKWPEKALRTYILTQLNWNPSQLVWVSRASAKTRNAEKRRVLKYGV